MVKNRKNPNLKPSVKRWQLQPRFLLSYFLFISVNYNIMCVTSRQHGMDAFTYATCNNLLTIWWLNIIVSPHNIAFNIIEHNRCRTASTVRLCFKCLSHSLFYVTRYLWKDYIMSLLETALPLDRFPYLIMYFSFFSSTIVHKGTWHLDCRLIFSLVSSRIHAS